MKFIQTIVLSLICMFMFTGHVHAQKKKAVKGNGKIVKETREFSSFSGVQVGGAFDVEIHKGSAHQASIEADENVMERIKMEVKNDILRIKMDGWVRKVNKLKVVLIMDDLEYLSASGASDVEVVDDFSSNSFDLHASGAADVSLSIDTDDLKISMSGSCDIDLEGKAGDVQISMSGASDLDADDMRAKSVDIQSSGSSSASVYASERLVASASGASDINCEGNPSKTQVKSSGAADIDVN